MKETLGIARCRHQRFRLTGAFRYHTVSESLRNGVLVTTNETMVQESACSGNACLEEHLPGGQESSRSAMASPASLSVASDSCSLDDVMPSELAATVCPAAATRPP